MVSQGSIVSRVMFNSMVRHVTCTVMTPRHVAATESAVPVAGASALGIITARRAIRAHRTSTTPTPTPVAASFATQTRRAVDTENALSTASVGVPKTTSVTTAVIIAMPQRHVPETATVLLQESANVTMIFSLQLVRPTAMQLRFAMTMGAVPMGLCRYVFVTNTTMVSTAIYIAFLQNSVHATVMAAVTVHRLTTVQLVTCIAIR